MFNLISFRKMNGDKIYILFSPHAFEQKGIPLNRYLALDALLLEMVNADYFSECLVCDDIIQRTVYFLKCKLIILKLFMQ